MSGFTIPTWQIFLATAGLFSVSSVITVKNILPNSYLSKCIFAAYFLIGMVLALFPVIFLVIE
jgi:hypothetical protein